MTNPIAAEIAVLAEQVAAKVIAAQAPQLETFAESLATKVEAKIEALIASKL